MIYSMTQMLHYEKTREAIDRMVEALLFKSRKLLQRSVANLPLLRFLLSRFSFPLNLECSLIDFVTTLPEKKGHKKECVKKVICLLALLKRNSIETPAREIVNKYVSLSFTGCFHVVSSKKNLSGTQITFNFRRYCILFPLPLFHDQNWAGHKKRKGIPPPSIFSDRLLARL